MAAYRRQLAESLPLTGVAQLDPSEPSALHGISANLAEVYSEGHAWELVRVLCRRHGNKLLDRYGIRQRHVGQDGQMLGCSAEALRRNRTFCTARHLVFANGVSSYPIVPDLP